MKISSFIQSLNFKLNIWNFAIDRSELQIRKFSSQKLRLSSDFWEGERFLRFCFSFFSHLDFCYFQTCCEYGKNAHKELSKNAKISKQSNQQAVQALNFKGIACYSKSWNFHGAFQLESFKTFCRSQMVHQSTAIDWRTAVSRTVLNYERRKNVRLPNGIRVTLSALCSNFWSKSRGNALAVMPSQQVEPRRASSPWTS